MSEDKTPGTAVAVRERLIVQAPVAIWDTGDFEQMQRVAVVLTKSGLVPETLCKDGSEWLPEAVVAARCTLVCNQARLWGADPLNVLQCTSLINGRLMYEGKLIAAVVASMTGVKLRYKFGVWDTDHINFPDDESGLHGAGDRLAVRCFDPDDPDRYVDGSVGLWKTTRSGSPWSSPNAWPRQLRYRAAREWARAYEPGVILGILADGDQDLDDLNMEAKPVGLMQRLKGTQEGDGFDHATVAEQTEKPKRRSRKPELVNETAETEHVEAEVSEIEAVVNKPHADPGEVYLLAGDGYNNDHRRLTYKDGVRFSTTHKESEGKYAEYEEHAPEVKPADDGIPEHMRDDVAPASVDAARLESLTEGVEPYQDGEDVPEDVLEHPTETGSVPPAEPEPDEGQADSDDFPPDFKAFIDAVESAGTWEEVKLALRAFYATDTFKGMDEEAQNKVRADTWDACDERRREGAMRDFPDHVDDLSVYRLWIEACTDADAIKGTFFTLQRGDQWKAANERARGVLEDATNARLRSL